MTRVPRVRVAGNISETIVLLLRGRHCETHTHTHTYTHVQGEQVKRALAYGRSLTARVRRDLSASERPGTLFYLAGEVFRGLTSV